MARHRTGDDGGRSPSNHLRAGRSPGPSLFTKGQARVSRTEASARESALLERITAYLATQPRCWVRKIHGSVYTAGIPDLVGCANGLFFAIELKKAGEVPSKLQEAELKKINAAKGHAVWCDNFEDFLHWWRTWRWLG